MLLNDEYGLDEEKWLGSLQELVLLCLLSQIEEVFPITKVKIQILVWIFTSRIFQFAF